MGLGCQQCQWSKINQLKQEGKQSTGTMCASACSSTRSSVDLCYVGCEHNKLLQPTAFAPVVCCAFNTKVLTPLNTAQDLDPSFNAFFRAIVLHPLSTRSQICHQITPFQHACFLKNQTQHASYQYFWKIRPPVSFLPYSYFFEEH